jgi:membrane protease YdiL (CAAX protease family)
MNLFWIDHFLFIIVGIVIPALSVMSMNKVDEVDMELIDLPRPSKKRIYYTNGLILWIGVLVILFSWYFGPKPFNLLGLQSPKFSTYTLIFSIALLVIYLIDLVKSYKDYEIPSEEENKFFEDIMPKNWKEYAHFCFLAISAGVCEEFIFRGFLINYLNVVLETTGYSLVIACILTSVIFAMSHLQQGFDNVLKIAVLALLFALIFILSESLLIVIILHAFVDLVSGAMMVISSQKTINSKKTKADELHPE